MHIQYKGSLEVQIHWHFIAEKYRAYIEGKLQKCTLSQVTISNA